MPGDTTEQKVSILIKNNTIEMTKVNIDDDMNRKYKESLYKNEIIFFNAAKENNELKDFIEKYESNVINNLTTEKNIDNSENEYDNNIHVDPEDIKVNELSEEKNDTVQPTVIPSNVPVPELEISDTSKEDEVRPTIETSIETPPQEDEWNGKKYKDRLDEIKNYKNQLKDIKGLDVIKLENSKRKNSNKMTEEEEKNLKGIVERYIEHYSGMIEVSEEEKDLHKEYYNVKNYGNNQDKKLQEINNKVHTLTTKRRLKLSLKIPADEDWEKWKKYNQGVEYDDDDIIDHYMNTRIHEVLIKDQVSHGGKSFKKNKKRRKRVRKQRNTKKTKKKGQKKQIKNKKNKKIKKVTRKRK